MDPFDIAAGSLVSIQPMACLFSVKDPADLLDSFAYVVNKTEGYGIVLGSVYYDKYVFGWFPVLTSYGLRWVRKGRLVLDP